MNILLIWPPSPEYHILTEDFSCCEPLGLEYLAAAVEDRHQVTILDMRLEHNFFHHLETRHYDVVGLSIPYTVSVYSCNKLVRSIKEFDPGLKVVVGGHYPTVTLEHLLLECIDYIVVGEGVHIFRELVDTLAYGGDTRDIKGLRHISDDRPQSFTPRDLHDIDGFPFPARHLLSKYKDTYFHAHYKPVSLARFSIGCPYNCTFCILWKLTNRRYLARQNDAIVAELRSLHENVYVVDDEAFIQTDRMLELADLLLRNGIRKNYHMYVRSDTVVKKPELMEAWAEAGLDSVLIGMEFINDQHLRKYNKSITMDNAFESVHILHANGVEVRANFIVTPDFTLEDFARLKEIIFKLDIDKPTFSIITPFVGTDEYRANRHRFISHNLELYDCFHTFYATHLPIDVFYREFADLFQYSSLRDTNANTKVFYAGKNARAFDDMLQKMVDSYKFYI